MTPPFGLKEKVGDDALLQMVITQGKTRKIKPSEFEKTGYGKCFRPLWMSGAWFAGVGRKILRHCFPDKR